MIDYPCYVDIDSCLVQGYFFLDARGKFAGWHFSNATHLFPGEYSPASSCKMTTLSQNIQKRDTPRQTRMTHMTDNLSKLAYVSFVWELKREDSWGGSDGNLFLRQYASTTCMSQVIIYSLLSEQNVWINSCECFWTAWGARINLHIFHAWIWVIDSQMRIKFCILICHWSNYKWEHNSYNWVFCNS